MYKDNIQLRSEKVRRVIGQIPPKITRVGIIVISFIIMSLFIVAYFIKFDYNIKTTATIECKKNAAIAVIKIPADKTKKIKKGQKVILNFDNIPHIHNKKLIVAISSISDSVDIFSSGAYYLETIILKKGALEKYGFNFRLHEKIEIIATIVADKINLLNKIAEFFNE